MKRSTSLAFVSLLVVSLLLVPGAALAANRNVAQASTATYTVAAGDYDVFSFSAAAGRLSARVSSISGGTVDIYVFNTGQLAAYEDPNAPSFGFEEDKERTSGSTSISTTLLSGLHLVVDNAAISASGANPSGPVTYTVTFEVNTGPDPALVGGVLLLIIVLIAVVAVVSRRKRRQAALNSPVIPPPAGYGAPAYGAPPPQYGAGAYGGGTPQYGAGGYGGGTPQYGAGAPAAGQPTYARPAPAAPPTTGTAPATNTAPCPYCSTQVAFYTAKCPSCGMDINWS